MSAQPPLEQDDRTIERSPVGSTSRAATIEKLGIGVWLAALAAYLAWLIGFGVNV